MTMTMTAGTPPPDRIRPAAVAVVLLGDLIAPAGYGDDGHDRAPAAAAADRDQACGRSPGPGDPVDLGEPPDLPGDPRRPAGRRTAVRPHLHRLRSGPRRGRDPLQRRLARGGRDAGGRGGHQLANPPPLPPART